MNLLQLLDPLWTALVHELIDLPQEIAVHDTEGVLQLRRGPDGALAALELELRGHGHGDLHHLLVPLYVAADGMGAELVLVLRLGQRLDQLLALGREVDGAAHVAEAPGELLLLHPFLDLGAGPGLLQPALEVGARGLALDENAAEALLARLQLPLLALVLLQR